MGAQVQRDRSRPDDRGARYSKAQILEAYLNDVYLGQHGAQSVHGIGAAAEFHFGRDLETLAPHGNGAAGRHDPGAVAVRPAAFAGEGIEASQPGAARNAGGRPAQRHRSQGPAASGPERDAERRDRTQSLSRVHRAGAGTDGARLRRRRPVQRRSCHSHHIGAVDTGLCRARRDREGKDAGERHQWSASGDGGDARRHRRDRSRGRRPRSATAGLQSRSHGGTPDWLTGQTLRVSGGAAQPERWSLMTVLPDRAVRYGSAMARSGNREMPTTSNMAMSH
ncbi:MAG: transglycosylase domain-containing protein [Rhodanobacteraceae bacterium]|nr:transglycosylase domain-containing protein [Rhodanobacteraceae bacterium]